MNMSMNKNIYRYCDAVLNACVTTILILLLDYYEKIIPTIKQKCESKLIALFSKFINQSCGGQLAV